MLTANIKFYHFDAVSVEGTANDCNEGSFCANGASSSVPDNSTVYECPIGQYCPSGTFLASFFYILKSYIKA